jgi:hypothetical protein
MNVGTEITAWAELRSMIDRLLGEPEALLNTEQAAAYLNIAPESLRRLVRRKADLIRSGVAVGVSVPY